ncbi:MAG: hypothetical protein CMG16_00105 [Candidatus Marinimicrobia bacterium]|nr:hypothetical protein [Candidatus Neomarinimicrobiota bacterium]|tara:strand:+ start:5901 stop:6641 length:741 start_codon:yes stop_codon:yes gene_type:complete
MFRNFIIIFFNLTIVLSQNIDELFEIGNKFYIQNNYEEAIIMYEKVLDSGSFSEDLFLNLGNAYFHESNFGQARWSYEMGLKLNPINTDLKNNNNVNKLYIDDFIELPKNNLIDITNIFFQSFSLNQFLLINSLLVLLSAISFFMIKVFQMKVRSKIFYFIIIIMFLSVLVTFTKNIWDKNNTFAIIIDQEVLVYSAPFSNQAIEKSIFYSGNKVKIHQKTDLWIEVSAFDGRKGWIQAQDVRNLY